MHKTLMGVAALVACMLAALAAQTRTTLDMYLIDVEGGNATLFVAPSGETILIDTGNGGAAAARDADRIAAAATDAGVTRIDHLITTHYHADHFGAMAEVAARFPVAQFIDHGANVQPGEAVDAFLSKTYPALYAGKTHTVVKPGDAVAVRGLEVRIVTAAGRGVTTSLPGAGAANPYCAAFKPQAPDPGENAQSVGTHVTFGRFRLAHLGDLTWNKEFDLMCPANRLGPVDVFVVSHHGQPISNSEVLVHALRPRVALLNNGTRKGGQPPAMRVLFSSPGLEDLWQLHFSQLSGQEYTVPGMFIANGIDEPLSAMPIEPAAFAPPGPGTPAPPAHNGAAHWLKLSAHRDGSFDVTNARNGFRKTYAAR
jgi:beta-lactamase superfamily II metal-dependent hydrolase